MNETLLTVKNFHGASCGKPPRIKAAPVPGYTGYFENPYGEQWVLRWLPTEKFVRLYGGDIGWGHPQKIPLPPKLPAYDNLGSVIAHLTKSLKIMLNVPEQLWLAGCMLAIAMRRWA